MLPPRISRGRIALPVALVLCVVLSAVKVRAQATRNPYTKDAIAGMLKGDLAPVPCAQPARIIIQTLPATQIYLDDTFQGQASPEGRQAIASPAADEHTLRVSLGGKKDFDQKITVAPGKTANVEATLADLPGSIAIKSSPGGAVFLDSASRGTTDQNGQLAIPGVTGGGIHPLRISATGKKEFRQSVTVVAGITGPVEAQLSDPLVAGTVQVNPKDGLKYVWIPPGTFMMGCSPGDDECNDFEKPAHRVTITRGFWMGQTEVTVGAYKRFTRETGKPMPPEPNILGRALNGGWNDEAMPIVDVTWDEARDYCAWAGGRMPTEAEWEYAARGGSSEARYGPLDDVAWYADNSGEQRLDSTRIWNQDQKKYGQRLKDNRNGMHEVGQKRANGFGLFDVLGNVWEWVNDWYDANYYQNSPSQDPTGPPSGTARVLRDGSWAVPWLLRVSFRDGLGPGSRFNDFGFRCHREVVNP